MTVRPNSRGAAPVPVPTLFLAPLACAVLTCLALGIAASPAYADTGITDLGTLGGTSPNAHGVNAAGDVVVGEFRLLLAAPKHAFLWSATSNTMTDLGTLGGTSSIARGVNAAGDVVVGESTNAGGTAHAFRWTAATGMTDLGTLGGSSLKRRHQRRWQRRCRLRLPHGPPVPMPSLDGSWRYDRPRHPWRIDIARIRYQRRRRRRCRLRLPHGRYQFPCSRWTAAGGMADLGTLGGTSSANGTNAAGDVVVGSSKRLGSPYSACLSLDASLRHG